MVRKEDLDIDFTTSKSGRRLLVLAGRTHIPLDKIIGVFAGDDNDPVEEFEDGAPYVVDIYIDGLRALQGENAPGALTMRYETSEQAVEAAKIIADEL